MLGGRTKHDFSKSAAASLAQCCSNTGTRMARGCAIDLGVAQPLDGQIPLRWLGSTQQTCSAILRHRCRPGLVSLLVLSCQAVGLMPPSGSELVSSWESSHLTLRVFCVPEVRVHHPGTRASVCRHSAWQCRRTRPVRKLVNLTRRGLRYIVSFNTKREITYMGYTSLVVPTVSQKLSSLSDRCTQALQ